jgi:hypothetical protein
MKIVELTPQFVARLLESVAFSAVDRGGEAIPMASDARKLPLFRQSRSAPSPEELLEDCRRLHRSRPEWMAVSERAHVTPEQVAQREDCFRSRSADYRPGHFLSLVRLGLDIEETEQTGVTVLERRSLHILQRRLSEMQRTERPAPPERVASWLSDFRSGDSWRLRGQVDLLRYVDEITGHPLIGSPDQATSDIVQLLLSLHWSLRTLAPDRASPLGPTPLDLCLGARAVLANAGVLHLGLGTLQDLVLSPEIPLWSRLKEWVGGIDHAREATFQLPPTETKPEFLVEGRGLRAFDLVLIVGERLERSARRLSIDESLVALERTLHRRIHRQEMRKRHMGILLRRVFERALNERHRRSMRMVPRPSSSAAPAARGGATRSDSFASHPWAGLKERAEVLEESRAWGCTVSAKAAWELLLPGEPVRSGDLADLDEMLRWTLDCRDDLGQALELLAASTREALAEWFLYLSSQAQAVEPPRLSRSRPRHRRERATPLQWYSVACVLAPSTGLDAAALMRRPSLVASAIPSDRVSQSLSVWMQCHPWDRGLCGIWPPELRGPALVDGVRAGVLRARFDNTPWWELDVRLGMLERELEYRCWLGARERVHLLEQTLSDARVRAVKRS